MTISQYDKRKGGSRMTKYLTWAIEEMVGSLRKETQEEKLWLDNEYIEFSFRNMEVEVTSK